MCRTCDFLLVTSHVYGTAAAAAVGQRQSHVHTGHHRCKKACASKQHCQNSSAQVQLVCLRCLCQHARWSKCCPCCRLCAPVGVLQMGFRCSLSTPASSVGALAQASAGTTTPTGAAVTIKSLPATHDSCTPVATTDPGSACTAIHLLVAKSQPFAL